MIDWKERFLKYTDRRGEEECWPYIGYVNKQGYGRFKYFGKGIPANRACYLIFVGPLESHLQVHHKCENRACVNPKHLKPLTVRDHILNHTPKSWAYQLSRKTHCVNGHELTTENIIPWVFRKTGHRKCWTCYKRIAHKRNRDPAFMKRHAEWKRQWKAKREAAALQGNAHQA